MIKYTSKNLTKGSAQLSELGKYIDIELNAAVDARSSLKDRWEMNEKVYRNDPSIAGVKLYDNFESRAVPVMSPRINRIVNVTMGNITDPSPMLQATPDDYNQAGADALEKGVDAIWDKAGFERVLRRALTTACLCGVSIIRERMTETGVKLDHIHPNDFVVAPIYGLDIKDSHLVGHRFYLPAWAVRDRVKSGLYDMISESDVDRLSATSPDDDPSGRDPDYDRTDSQLFGNNETRMIELWELLVRLEIDGKRQWCRIVYDRVSTKVLLKEAYPYSRPWYFEMRLHDEEGKFWPANSVAQNIVGLCILQSNMFNLAVAGSMATAAPPTVISGGTLGKQYKALNLGMIIESPYDLKVQAIPMEFNVGAMPQLMSFLNDQIEAQTGIYNQRLNAERKSGDVTATQITAEETAANQNESAYPSFAADFVEDMAEFLHELARSHAGMFRKVYDGILQQEFFNALAAKVRWHVTGRRSGNSPQILLGKLQALLTMAAQPQSGFNYTKVESAIADAMQLPINIEGLKKTDEQMAQEAQAMAAMAQQQAQGMAPQAQAQGQIAQ